jgi:hypothetical protein
MREHIADIWYKRRDNNDEDAIRIEQHRVALTAMWANVYRVWLRKGPVLLSPYVHRVFCLLDARAVQWMVRAAMDYECHAMGCSCT